MVPGTMSSLAVASMVSRSATGSKGLRFVADAAVPPKEHATATTSAGIRVVMISLLGQADELTVGPPTYGTKRTYPSRRSMSAFGGKSGKHLLALSPTVLNPQPTTQVKAHPAVLERQDYTLVPWYRFLHAPRTGGAHDSHHRTAGIAGRARRRGSRVAARGGGAAAVHAGDRIFQPQPQL